MKIGEKNMKGLETFLRCLETFFVKELFVLSSLDIGSPPMENVAKRRTDRRGLDRGGTKIGLNPFMKTAMIAENT